ncbi:hypothetical protein RQP46_001154 [Phenoliferia psychrophenolica]
MRWEWSHGYACGSSWVSVKPGSRITFAFEGTEVGLWFWEGNGIGSKMLPGAVSAHIDNRTSLTAEVDAFDPRVAAGTTWVPLFDRLAPGPHLTG